MKIRNTFNPLFPATIGFDNLFHDLDRLLQSVEPSVEKFPPHNIIKIDDHKYVVELAVAGFSKDDIDITVEDGYLIIKGSTSDNKDTGVQYLHKGIGTRSFTKTIKLVDTVEVRGAEFKDGILRVGLENVIPEHKKPKKVEIVDQLNFNNPQLLTE